MMAVGSPPEVCPHPAATHSEVLGQEMLLRSPFVSLVGIGRLT